FADEFSGAHGVEKAFTVDRNDECGSVAYQRPIFADDGALRKCRNLRRRENVAVKAGGFGGKLLFADESLQVRAEFRLIVRSHAAADTDRQMIATREGPDVAVKMRK